MTDFSKILKAAQERQGQAPAFKPTDSTTPLDQIKNREQDTRSLNPVHVSTLAESIAVLGLIEPLVLDNQGRLLAGGHRLAAIRHLRQEQPEAYEKRFPDARIPTRSLPFDADEQPDLALQIEVAENEQRRDYTAAEVKAIAERLRSAGYVELKGRPKKGEKALMPALAVVVGKHLRTIQRYLSEDDKPAPEKSTTRVVLLQQAVNKLIQWQASVPEDEQSVAFSRQIDKFLKQVDRYLDQVEQ